MYLGNGIGRCYLSYGWLIICPQALYVSPSPVGKCTARTLQTTWEGRHAWLGEMRAVKFDLSSMSNKYQTNRPPRVCVTKLQKPSLKDRVSNQQQTLSATQCGL